MYLYIGLLFVLVFVVLTLVAFRPYIENNIRFSKVDQLPGPPKHPIYGTILDLPKDKTKFLEHNLNNRRKYGHIFRSWVGPRPVISISSPEMLRKVMSTSTHNEKSFFYDNLVPWLGTGLLISNGAKWHKRRRIITPSFHFEVLNSFNHVFNDQADVLVQELEKSLTTPIDFFNKITLCTLDIICETAMGKKLNAQQSNREEKYIKAVYQVSELLTKRNRTPWYIYDFIYYNSNQGKSFKQALQTLHDFTNRVIKERRAAHAAGNVDIVNKKRMAFLDILLSSTDEDGQHLSDDDIREEVDTFMFEGHDTTSAALAWCIYLISSHPDVQERLHEEVDRVLSDRKEIDTDKLNELTYMEAVLKESLRLYPSVTMISRKLSEETELGGYSLPSGVTVGLSIYALHHNQEVWPDAERFDPERFIKSDPNRDPYAFVPFSAGPRNCIGQKFAIMEEKIILSKILQNFSVVNEKEREPVPVTELILRPINGIWVTFSKRNK